MLDNKRKSFSWKWCASIVLSGAAVWAQAQEGGVALNSAEQPATDVVVAALDNGAVITAWCAFDGEWFRLMARISPDGGATWDDPVQLSSGDSDAYYPAIDAEGGTAYLAWVETDGLKYGRVVVRTTLDNGATWSAQASLSELQPGVSGTRLDARGTSAWIVWTDGASGAPSVMAVSTDDSGANWTAPEAVAAGASPCRHPDVAIADGRTYVIWEQWGAFAPEVYCAQKPDAGTWEEPVLLSADDRWASEFPTIATNGADAFAAWQEDTADGSILRFSHYRNGQPLWDMPVTLTAAGFSRHPSLDAVGQRLVLAFDRLDGEGQQAVLLESRDAGATWGEAQVLSATESEWNGLVHVDLSPVYYYTAWTQPGDGTVRLAADPAGVAPEAPVSGMAGAALLWVLCAVSGWRVIRRAGR